MLDNTARMIGTVGIWASAAVMVAFGLCRMNFNRAPDFVLALAIVCIAAVVATGIVWWGASRRRERMSTEATPGGFPVVAASGELQR